MADIGNSYLQAFLPTLAPVLPGNKYRFLLQRLRRHNLPHPHRRHHHRPLLLRSPAHLTSGRGCQELLHTLQNVTVIRLLHSIFLTFKAVVYNAKKFLLM